MKDYKATRINVISAWDTDELRSDVHAEMLDYQDNVIYDLGVMPVWRHESNVRLPSLPYRIQSWENMATVKTADSVG